MRLLELLENQSVIIVENADPIGDVEITEICHSSSRVEEGSLYIAIEGLRFDGHAFIGDAVKKGAAAIAVTKCAIDDGRIDPSGLRIPIIVCENTRRLMSCLYSVWYGEPHKNLKMIGVTGTNGKTSVSRLIYEMLRRSGRRCALIGTVGCRTDKRRLEEKNDDPNANMTTPDPEQLFKMLREAVLDGCEYAVMEVTSHALYFDKVAPICFDIGVFTNLTEDHLDLHGDMDSYFAAKERLFLQSKRAVINYDDRYGRILAERIDIPMILCSGEGRGTACSIEDVRLHGEKGIEYKLTSRNLRLRIRSPLVGGYNVTNTALAAVSAQLLGLSAVEIKDGLAHFSGIEGRLQRLKFSERVDFSVYLDYAHTPDALENLLRAVRGFTPPEKRIVLLFGCGGDRDRGKRANMGKIAADMADMVIVTSDNSRSEDAADIIADVLRGMDGISIASYRVIEDRRAAIEYAIKNARRGDVILLAGKGHENYEITRDGRKRFCESEIVSEYVRKYYG